MSPVESVFQLLATDGDRQFVDDGLSHLSHALRCATLAERSGAASHLVVAALVHGVGNLLDPRTARKVSSMPLVESSQSGSRYLARWFAPEVVEPVRMQPDADRLLCAVDMDYFVRLSADAIAALVRHGGPMNQEEARRFVDHPFADDTVRLRLWHQQAKDPVTQTADLPWFRHYLESSLLVGFQVA